MNQSFGQSDTPDERPQPIFFARKEFDGTNSEIREHHYPDGKRLVVTRLGARKGGFSFDEAHKIVQNARSYHEELTALGVPLPEIEQLYVEYEPSLDRSVVVKASPWAGHEVKKIILESQPDQVLPLVETMVNITKCVGKQRHDGFALTVGIDPQPSNFIMDDQGVMRYVDLFPTRIRTNGEPIVEWPTPQTPLGQELGHFKHFDLRGIMLTLSAQLARLRPEMKEEIEDVIFNGFKDVFKNKEYDDFTSEILKSPWIRLRQPLKDEDQKACLSCFDSALTDRPFGINYNIYTLREMALELAAHGKINSDDLAKFFKDSHFEDELPTEKVVKLHKYLKNKL